MSEVNETQLLANAIPETSWAYIAGMIDGEGHLSMFRHYKKNGSSSKRGYEIEPHLEIANMNKESLIDISNLLGGMGKITTLILRREGQDPFENYNIRFRVSEQRIILPKVLPHLLLKKETASIILRLLDYRLTHKHLKQADKAEREKFYLQLEEEYRCAMMKEKPWLLLAIGQGGRLCKRNRNLVEGYKNHTYVRNIEPDHIKRYDSKVTRESLQKELEGGANNEGNASANA